MRIDIAGIAGINSAYLEVSNDISTETLESGITGIKLDEKVHADLKIEYMEGIIIVRGYISGSYTAQCGRCLENIRKKFSINIDEKFIHLSGNMDSTDDYLYDGNYIDMTIPIIDNILLSFPGVTLCNDDCKGLCAICGTDLNVEQCSCEKHEINIKMDKLKEFFNQ